MNIGRFCGVRLEDDWGRYEVCAEHEQEVYVDIDGTTDSDLQAQIDARLDAVCESMGTNKLHGLQLSLIISKRDAARILIWYDGADDTIEIPVSVTHEEVVGIVGVYIAGYTQLLKKAWENQ